MRPAPALPPGKFETGTQNHEGIAGVLGALEYLEWVGKTFGAVYAETYQDRFQGRRLRFKQAMAAIRAYEFESSRKLLNIFASIPGVQLYGPDDVRRLEERVPTFAIRVAGLSPRQVAEKLAQEDIYVWDGNYYALAVTERLGVENTGGMVRIGPVHYNTLEEIDCFGNRLEQIARGS